MKRRKLNCDSEAVDVDDDDDAVMIFASLFVFEVPKLSYENSNASPIQKLDSPLVDTPAPTYRT